jgi:hypothetical protein
MRLILSATQHPSSLRLRPVRPRAVRRNGWWPAARGGFGGILGVAVGILALTGCGERRTAFNMVTIDPTGASERFHETFDECYFSVSPHRRVDVIARRVIETGPDEPPISQLVHLRTAYRTMPGVTHAESSMINATVHYVILDGFGGTCYEGAGHLSTHESRDGRVMTGKLEHAQVTRNRHMIETGPDEPPISQLVHLRTAYRTMPGVTHAESSMINATVHYVILDGFGGTCYEGAGHLSTHESRDGRVMTGKLEHAQVTRNRHIGQGGDIFVRAKLRGGYHAVRNRRKVVAMLNEINRLLGPQPDYTDQPTNDPL